MHNQKDNNPNNLENKEVSTVRGFTVSNYYNVFDNQNYVDLARRSQKIVTALYMLTDFLGTSDPLREHVRNNIVEGMSQLFGLINSQQNDRTLGLSRAVNLIFTTISSFEIMYRNGYISEMNYTLVNKELHKLQRDVDAQITKSLSYHTTKPNTRSIADVRFADSFFEPKGMPSPEHQRHVQREHLASPRSETIKDTETVGTDPKKTSEAEPVFVTKSSKTKQSSLHPRKTTIKDTRAPKNNDAKEERKDNIIKILKQKQDASINDISVLIKDCSSKTIQRDLSELIDEGMVVKEGSRRWSKYNLTYDRS